MVRDFDRQVGEIQIRTAVLKGYTALVISVTEPVGRARLGKCGQQRICATELKNRQT